MKRTTLLLVASLLAIVPHAQATVLCRTRTDTVKIRDVCQPHETQVDPVALGLQRRLVVKDTNGAVVGQLTDQDSTDFFHGGLGPSITKAVRRVNDQPLSFWVSDSGFVDMIGLLSALRFESSDCSGPALVEVGPSGLLLPELYVHGTTGYYGSPPVASHSIGAYLGFITSEATCFADGGTSFVQPDECCFNYPFSAVGAPAATVDIASLGLVPPFHVEGP